MNDERWLPVTGYEDWYEVSNLGRVRRSRPGQHTSVGRIMKPTLGIDGYLVVGLWRGNKRSKQRIHRLVALAFFPSEAAPGLEVNHKDGVKTNNTVSNLEWCTRQWNIQHARQSGLLARGPRKSQLTPEAVEEMRRLRAEGVTVRELMRKFDRSQVRVWEITSKGR